MNQRAPKFSRLFPSGKKIDVASSVLSVTVVTCGYRKFTLCTSDSDNDEDELEILSTFALAFVKDEK